MFQNRKLEQITQNIKTNQAYGKENMASKA